MPKDEAFLAKLARKGYIYRSVSSDRTYYVSSVGEAVLGKDLQNRK